VADTLRWAPGETAQVDWSHPLAPAGGWGAVPGLGVDFYGQQGTLTVAAGYGSSLYGRALSCSSATTGGIQFPFPERLRSATAALTLVTLTSIDGLNANNNTLLVIRDNSTEANPFLDAAVYETANSGGTATVAIRNQAGAFTSAALGGAGAAGEFPTGNGMRMYAAVLAPPSASLYTNGRFIATATLSGSPTGITYGAAPHPGIAVSGYGTNTTNQGILGTTALALIYPRALSAPEVAALWADPFCMILED
jgi:hypothetical protein